MSAHLKRGGAAALVINLLVPIVVYYGLRSTGVDLYLAVLASAVAPGIGAVIGVVRRGRVEPLAALGLTGLAVTIALSLAGGGPRLLLAKEGWLTGITGVWFLVSARSSRPLALLLTEPFLPHARWRFTGDWDALWERQPRFRRIWRTSSVLWGLGTLADSVVRVVIAYTLPIDAVPAIGAALYLATSALLIVVTNVYYARAGLWTMLRAPSSDGATTGAGRSASQDLAPTQPMPLDGDTTPEPTQHPPRHLQQARGDACDPPPSSPASRPTPSYTPSTRKGHDSPRLHERRSHDFFSR